MKTLVILCAFFLATVLLFGADNTIPPVKDVEDFDSLRRTLSRVIESLMPRNGGDELFYRDVKNERIGIGTLTPQAGLDVVNDGLGFPPSSDIDGAISAERAGIAYMNSNVPGQVCISTAANNTGAWTILGSTVTPCSN